MLSQSEIVDLLNGDGYDLGIRTLRYWRSVGLLPKLQQEGIHYGYDLEIINDIKELCNKFSRLIGDIIFIYTIEGNSFNVYRYIVEKPKEYNGKYRLTFYTNKGIIITRRENLDELLR